VILTREFSDSEIITSLAVPAALIVLFIVMICLLYLLDKHAQSVQSNSNINTELGIQTTLQSELIA